MGRAWYMLSEITDQRLENHLDPPQFVDMAVVNAETGVLLYEVILDTDAEWKEIVQKHNLVFVFDQHCSRETPDYNDFMRIIFTEHSHDYPGIRLITAGSGYFDVRDRSNRWIRIEVVTGDFIIIPGGISHRFTMDSNESVTSKKFDDA
ncbi:hypothetical protein PPYR_05709 [Photinus pyralis]|uniref:acireductone dioxygenase (Fe(2+)-requiring) n=1 Tax=Photinus pyralis TaxID=7054 RepID=A0A5N4AVF4_PHOPY|nr:1,2-dihydroxy-3-keto-5-methylthiopentene dioxygenase-like [Photinus pyralis]KAB0801355.1 hypothetical protein PPYR_05709 [Photinus pyralis]